MDPHPSPPTPSPPTPPAHTTSLRAGLGLEDLAVLAELLDLLGSGAPLQLDPSGPLRRYLRAELSLDTPLGSEPWADQVATGRAFLSAGAVTRVTPKSAAAVGQVLDQLTSLHQASLSHDAPSLASAVALAHDLVLACALSLSTARQQRDAALRGFTEAQGLTRAASAEAETLRHALNAAHRALAHNAGHGGGPVPFGHHAATVAERAGEGVSANAETLTPAQA